MTMILPPLQETNNPKTNNILCSIFDSSDLQSKSYSDQTGKFPVKSISGNQYIFILYHYDTNSIHAVPIKSRHTTHITEAWNKIFHLLQIMASNQQSTSWTTSAPSK